MGLNKRRKEKSYSLDEMFAVINDNFISSSESKNTPHYVVSPTCFKDIEKNFLVCDSRETGNNVEDYEGKLEFYYGKTIIEAVTKCFVDFRKNG
ncbi:hypothetical protein [Clostridium sp.]|jgi:hypothetical protein|uniref:hypothetical protein n=1 Tax=Clostridium sp. TaxID=1506 RepID=UPI003EEC6EB0